jgi:uncharacterized membrane protein
MILDIFALVVLLILIALCIALVVVLGPVPGKIAQQRNHPQADAIQVMGWIGLITLGLPWLIALVWAYTKPFQSVSGDPQLAERVSSLENQLQQLTEGGKDS